MRERFPGYKIPDAQLRAAVVPVLPFVRARPDYHIVELDPPAFRSDLLQQYCPTPIAAPVPTVNVQDYPAGAIIGEWVARAPTG
jgi:hypothetical protein